MKNKLCKDFGHMLAWQPSWSCDLDHVYKLSFHLVGLNLISYGNDEAY